MQYFNSMYAVSTAYMLLKDSYRYGMVSGWCNQPDTTPYRTDTPAAAGTDAVCGYSHIQHQYPSRTVLLDVAYKCIYSVAGRQSMDTASLSDAVHSSIPQCDSTVYAVQLLRRLRRLGSSTATMHATHA